jgi:hypothetical protein
MFRRRFLSGSTRAVFIAASLALVVMVPIALATSVHSVSAQRANYRLAAVDDTTAPTTTLTSTPTANGAGWNSTDVTISLAATDGVGNSGVASTWYAVDSGTVTTYTTAFGITTEGTHSVGYASVDTSGNAETTHTSTIKIDKTAPATTDNHVTTYTASASISLTASDAVSGVASTRYALDSVAGTGTTVSSNTTGTHTLAYSSLDNADNRETTHSVTFSVVATPPVTTISTLPSGWTGANVDFSLVATDPYLPSGITKYYKLNDTTLTAYTTTVTVTSEGTTTISYFSVDASGTAETTHTATVKIDKSPPATTDSHVPTYTASASISLTASDALSGVAGTRYALDGGATTTGTTVATSVLGTHTLTYASVDEVGNTESTKTVNFTVAPRTYHATVMVLTGASSIKVRRTYRLAGRIWPNAAGGKRVRISLTRLVSGRWRAAGTGYAWAYSSGKFYYSFKPRYRGKWRLTVSYPGKTTATDVYGSSWRVKALRVK